MNPKTIASAYASQVNDILTRFTETQTPRLIEAAEFIVQAHRNNKRFLIFGTGHSHMIVEEFYARAGGLAFITPMLQNELTLTDHPFKSTHIERTLGMASVYFELYLPEPGDVMMIISNSGRNALPIELAKLAKANKVTVIGLINHSQSQTIGSRHPEGKNLHHYCDLIIDNCGAYGDAGYDLGDGIMMGSTSTIIGALAAQTISILVAAQLQDLGPRSPGIA
jgi:uncharacterized phosphosugar-binding protein